MRALLIALLLGVTLLAQADSTYESITVANTSIGITTAITNPSGQPQQNRCLARLETASIRYRVDGTAPTSSEGILIEVGDTIEISGNTVARIIRFIRTGSTSGVLKVSCWP